MARISTFFGKEKVEDIYIKFKKDTIPLIEKTREINCVRKDIENIMIPKIDGEINYDHFTDEIKNIDIEEVDDFLSKYPEYFTP